MYGSGAAQQRPSAMHRGLDELLQSRARGGAAHAPPGLLEEVGGQQAWAAFSRAFREHLRTKLL